MLGCTVFYVSDAPWVLAFVMCAPLVSGLALLQVADRRVKISAAELGPASLSSLAPYAKVVRTYIAACTVLSVVTTSIHVLVAAPYTYQGFELAYELAPFLVLLGISLVVLRGLNRLSGTASMELSPALDDESSSSRLLVPSLHHWPARGLTILGLLLVLVAEYDYLGSRLQVYTMDCVVVRPAPGGWAPIQAHIEYVSWRVSGGF